MFRRFVLRRLVDVSGLSGTGTVAEGVQFSDGRCALSWRPGVAGVVSLGLYNSASDVLKVHGHDGATVIDYVDMREPGGETSNGIECAERIGKASV